MFDKQIILHNAHLTDGAIGSFRLANGRISNYTNELPENAIEIDCTDLLLFPGLVNSHDHLHFNLFPQLGNRIYNNYVEWGDDIHKNNKAEIAEVLRVDKRLRVQWGIYKNLIAGVTTVVHHGDEPDIESSLINVFRQCYSLHSVQLEKRWRYRLNRPFRRGWPFAVHIGEGTDKLCADEINELLKWNLWKRKIIGIHAVGMNAEQAEKFAALVWCPQSNFFLLGRTAKMDQLKSATNILFGTDSTVSSEWSIWQHLRDARKTGMLTDKELINTVTGNATNAWRLQNTNLTSGKCNDIVLAKKKHADATDAFFAIDAGDIQLIFRNGVPLLIDISLCKHFFALEKNYSRVFIEGKEKLVIGDLVSLIKAIKKSGVNINLPIEVAG